MRLLCALGLAALVLQGCEQPSPWASHAEDPRWPARVDCAPGYPAHLAHAKQATLKDWRGVERDHPAEPGSGDNPLVYGPVWIFGSEAERRVYIFTRPGHPAHPAMVAKDVMIDPEGGANLAVRGCGWGDKQQYARFEAAQRALAEAFHLDISRHVGPGGVKVFR